MQLFKTVAGLQCYLAKIRSLPSGRDHLTEDKSAAPFQLPLVGLVPTMGALHKGHLSLIHRARQDNDVVIVSIFVNPLQFGPHEDLDQYPRDMELDRQHCEQAGVDAIFAPNVQEFYPESADPQSVVDPTQVIPPKSMISGLCGQTRPGHFEGVATVVTKLLSLVQPDHAYFGQKDAQQVAVLRRIIADLNLSTTLVPCPIVREENGLACSSRNQYLSPEQRSQAAVLYQSLKQAESRFQAGEYVRQSLIDAVKTELATVPQVRPEYIELVHPNTIEPLETVAETGLLAIAAHLGSTRLIDNLILRNRQPILAIDGPAGAGKSTVARLVAQSLDLMYLDTGAMYRAVTWFSLDSGVDIHDEPVIAELVSQCRIQLVTDEGESKVWINGQDVTQVIRSPEVTSQVSAISAQPYVRQALVQQQQQYGRKGGIVMEGRDIGTHVFPDAELKIFLTASVQERARRRQQDLQTQNQPQMDLAALTAAIQTRDEKDSTRAIAPLRKAHDAIELQTDGLTIAEVVDHIATLYRQLIHVF